jgi:hypothetical protein
MTIIEVAVLTWNTGEKSRFRITVNTDPTAGRLTVSAYFTSRPLAGDTANACPIVLRHQPRLRDKRADPDHLRSAAGDLGTAVTPRGA